ncbi:unnamed protein product, partial [Brassica rapa subsp. trilocularis]
SGRYLCNIQQNAFMSREDLVVFPKPRRVGLLSNNIIRPLRFHMRYTQKASSFFFSSFSDSLLIITNFVLICVILKVVLSFSTLFVERAVTIIIPTTLFPGSPPSRAVNPLAQDARFRDEKLTPVSPNSPFLHPSSSSDSFPSPSSSSSSRGCGRMKFGLKPPAVRVEGFDCLNRDRQNSSIPAMA